MESIPHGVVVRSGRLERYRSGDPSAVTPAPPSAMELDDERSLSLGTEVSASVPPPSPLTGCYLLAVIGEPHTQEHKEIILQRLVKGKFYVIWSFVKNVDVKVTDVIKSNLPVRFVYRRSYDVIILGITKRTFSFSFAEIKCEKVC